MTLVILACSGSDIVNGIFTPLDAREKFSEPGGSKTVVSQFDQLSDLICRNGAAGRTASASYTLPVYTSGNTAISSQTITKQWLPGCEPQTLDRSQLGTAQDPERDDRNRGATPRVIAPTVGRARHRLARKNVEDQQMNWDQIQGNWTKTKGKLRQQWGKLTDDDLTLINGKREELAGRLQERYGYQRDQAEREIDSWMNQAS